jgi:hypothetical protein
MRWVSGADAERRARARSSSETAAGDKRRTSPILRATWPQLSDAHRASDPRAWCAQETAAQCRFADPAKNKTVEIKKKINPSLSGKNKMFEIQKNDQTITQSNKTTFSQLKTHNKFVWNLVFVDSRQFSRHSVLRERRATAVENVAN